jgi:hypothetical protein
MNHEEVIDKIDKYLASEKHRPILVDVPSVNALKKLVQHYSIGKNNIIQTKRYCDEDGLPIMDRLKDALSKSDDIVFLDGLSWYFCLLGEDILRRELRSLLDLSIRNKLIILTIGCKRWVDDFDKRLFSSARIICEEGVIDELPTLYFWSKSIVPPEININGLGNLSQIAALLEVGYKDIPVVTNKRKVDFPNSLCCIAEYYSDYQILSSTYEEFANIGVAAGTFSQWGILRQKLAEYEKVGDFFNNLFGSTSGLANAINGFPNYDSFTRWAYFIALRIYGAIGNDYLSKVISNSKSFDEFIVNSFGTILLSSPEDKDFNKLYQQRKVIVAQMGDYSRELDLFCKQLYSKEEKSFFYLTDNTKREKEMTLELLYRYGSDYTQTELIEILTHTYLDLSTYLQPFDFNNDYLNKYFQLYKWSKVTNHIFPELIEMVNEQATQRKYNVWLHPRSAFIDVLSKEKDKDVLFFVDALGVEYLSYLQNKCFENELMFHADMARCELPSITCMNKDFVDEFKKKGCKVYDNKKLDALKHEGNNTYNYENNKLPIHIVEELDILNELLLQLKTIDKEQVAYVISDHGATRLAVINESENKWEMSEKGKHSGRCCPKSDTDEKPAFATEENDFWCLANYDRFKGGRAANVEVHGGATLEEVTVPIITISKQKEQIECKVIEKKPIMVSFKKKAILRLFVSKKTNKLSIVVNSKTYSAIATDTPYVYVVEMLDIKNAGKYSFNVLFDGMLVAKGLSFEVKKEGASERKFF